MQLKTIYTNLKSKYKLILWIVIFFTIYILYGLYNPKRYFFSCEGTQYVNTSQIIEDPLEPKKITKNSFVTKEDISVEKYFFGLFYTLNDMNILQCRQNSNAEIVCERGKDKRISFNPYKNTFNENFIFMDEGKNEKRDYFIIDIYCKKDINSLN
jgi:hypothetical protein